MDLFKKESLELLRTRIDLVEALEPHVDLKRSGATYKACCPFHDEKTPSFVVKRGDSHYHCFGCGAHGDALAFYMNHLRMSFTEAVKHLADRFQVSLEREEVRGDAPRVNTRELKEVLEKGAAFYHYCLLHTKEGHQALAYLYDRGLTLDFVKRFRLGWAPGGGDVLRHYLRAEKIPDAISESVGLTCVTQSGWQRDFFSDRVCFPVLDKMGAVIGFSARKIREETFGGKYINTPETPLFKKSQILFGLFESRKRIAKERKVIVVEGQIDALCLIYEGFDYVVAGQGTAFGEGHVSELVNLGVNHAYLALDGDGAGKAAAVKIGNLFQKRGVEVSVVSIPDGFDPDTLLKDVGPEGFDKLLAQSQKYLTFLVAYHAGQMDMHSPSGKNELVKALVAQIRSWDDSVMVHESLRTLATLLKIPENIIGVDEVSTPNLYVQKKVALSIYEINADEVLESDLIRWLFLEGESFPDLADLIERNIVKELFKVDVCRKAFTLFFEWKKGGKGCDLFAFNAQFSAPEEKAWFASLFEKKVNRERREEGVVEAIQKMLTRLWMEQREALSQKMREENLPDEEQMELARAFDVMKKALPKVVF